MKPFVIRDARSADAAAIAALHAASWRSAYADVLEASYLADGVVEDRLKLWTERMTEASSSQLIMVAEDAHGELVAFVCVFLDEDPTWGTLLDNLHVHPEVRGHGLGERLMGSVANFLFERTPDAKLHLWVFEKNRRALAFYERHGGHVVEQDVSELLQAQGNSVLRMYWPSLEPLRK